MALIDAGTAAEPVGLKDIVNVLQEIEALLVRANTLLEVLVDVEADTDLPQDEDSDTNPLS